MHDAVLIVLENLAAGVSIALMGLCGVKLLRRFVRVLRGEECADGLSGRRRGAPVWELAAAAGVMLISRLALYLLAYAMYRVLGVGSDGFLQSLEPLWTHWDSRHYIGIAQDWYTNAGDERLRLVFFPLYPLLMRGISPLTGGNLFAAGLMISLVCASAACALVYDLSYMTAGRKTALLSAAYFLLSPLSVFLCCAYTEALFICLTLAAVCLLRRGHPWLASLCGFLSAFTRMPGVIISGLLIIDWLGKLHGDGFRLRAALSCVGQVLLVFGGLFLYWGVNWAVTGDAMMYLTYQRENWFQQPGSFWGSTANTMHYFLTTVGEGDWLYTWGFQLLCMMIMYALLAFGEHRLPFDLAAYSFVYVTVVLSPTWLLYAPRYLYALCALPLLLARQRFGRAGHALMLAGSAVMLYIWVFGYTLAIQVL